MKIKKELKLVDYFKAHAILYLNENKEQTKFAYALNRMIKRIETEKVFEAYLEAIEELKQQAQDIKVMHASLNDLGNLIVSSDEKYSYTPEKEIQVRKELKELDKKWKVTNDKFLKTIVEIEPFIVDAKEVPNNLTFDQQEYFAGFVIAE